MIDTYEATNKKNLINMKSKNLSHVFFFLRMSLMFLNGEEVVGDNNNIVGHR